MGAVTERRRDGCSARWLLVNLRPLISKACTPKHKSETPIGTARPSHTSGRHAQQVQINAFQTESGMYAAPPAKEPLRLMFAQHPSTVVLKAHVSLSEAGGWGGINMYFDFCCKQAVSEIKLAWQASWLI